MYVYVCVNLWVYVCVLSYVCVSFPRPLALCPPFPRSGPLSKLSGVFPVSTTAEHDKRIAMGETARDTTCPLTRAHEQLVICDKKHTSTFLSSSRRFVVDRDPQKLLVSDNIMDGAVRHNRHPHRSLFEGQ